MTEGPVWLWGPKGPIALCLVPHPLAPLVSKLIPSTPAPPPSMDLKSPASGSRSWCAEACRFLHLPVALVDDCPGLSRPDGTLGQVS